VPRGLVSTSPSPARAPPLRHTLDGVDRADDREAVLGLLRPRRSDRPRWRCPRARATSAPPRRISPRSSTPRVFVGKRDDVQRDERHSRPSRTRRRWRWSRRCGRSPRVVDQRGEEVGGEDQREVVATGAPPRRRRPGRGRRSRWGPRAGAARAGPARDPSSGSCSLTPRRGPASSAGPVFSPLITVRLAQFSRQAHPREIARRVALAG
jgi:hypothetical protein